MLFVGSAVDRLPGPKYCAKLSFAEFAPRLPLPRIPTLRRMRHELPEGFSLALRAPRSCLTSARGPLRFDSELERSWQWLMNARDALAAKLVVLPTPAELLPGQRDRELLQELCARLPREAGRHWVWEPHGPWDLEDAAALASRLDLVLSVDPLIAPLPNGSVVYARLRALGERNSFSDAALEDVVERIGGTSSTERFVVFDATRAFDYAVRLRALTAGTDPGPPLEPIDDEGDDDDTEDDDEDASEPSGSPDDAD